MKKVVILSGIMIGLCGCPDAELYHRKQRDRDTYNTQVQQKVAQERENDVRKWQQQVAQELENDERKWQQAENRRQEHLARLNAATSLDDFKEFIREKREKYESTPWNEIRFWEVEYGDLNVDQMRREWYCANHLKLLLQPQIRNLILEGKVVMGMTAEQVRASLGGRAKSTARSTDTVRTNNGSTVIETISTSRTTYWMDGRTDYSLRA